MPGKQARSPRRPLPAQRRHSTAPCRQPDRFRRRSRMTRLAADGFAAGGADLPARGIRHPPPVPPGSPGACRKLSAKAPAGSRSGDFRKRAPSRMRVSRRSFPGTRSRRDGVQVRNPKVSQLKTGSRTLSRGLFLSSGRMGGCIRRCPLSCGRGRSGGALPEAGKAGRRDAGKGKGLPRIRRKRVNRLRERSGADMGGSPAGPGTPEPGNAGARARQGGGVQRG